MGKQVYKVILNTKDGVLGGDDVDDYIMCDSIKELVHKLVDLYIEDNAKVGKLYLNFYKVKELEGPKQKKRSMKNRTVLK